MINLTEWVNLTGGEWWDLFDSYAGRFSEGIPVHMYPKTISLSTMTQIVNEAVESGIPLSCDGYEDDYKQY